LHYINTNAVFYNIHYLLVGSTNHNVIETNCQTTRSELEIEVHT